MASNRTTDRSDSDASGVQEGIDGRVGALLQWTLWRKDRAKPPWPPFKFVGATPIIVGSGSHRNVPRARPPGEKVSSGEDLSQHIAPCQALRPDGFLVGLVAVDTLLAPTGAGALVVLAAAVLFGSVVAVATERQMRANVALIGRYLAAAENATRGNLTRGLAAFAAGDLTVELRAGTAPASAPDGDELGGILVQVERFRDAVMECYAHYNEAAARLRELVGHMSATAGSVRTASERMSSISDEAGQATGEIAQAITQVAEGTERQARMASDAQRSAVEIANAVAETAANVEHTAEVASTAHFVAQQGVDAAEKANAAMRSVTASSDEVTGTIRALAQKSAHVGKIVVTITAIAEQTNLLALNAAIEAARAGEQGRGFAVVAEEVRKLAEESARAAEEISELIATMQAETTQAVTVVEDGAKRTQDGAAVVEQTREAFLSIGRSVEDMNTRIEQIAAAANRSPPARTACNKRRRGRLRRRAVIRRHEQISASTEQTSAATQQVAASAHELADTARALNDLLTQFKLAA